MLFPRVWLRCVLWILIAASAPLHGSQESAVGEGGDEMTHHDPQLAPASTNEKPSVEPTAKLAISCGLPLKPELVMLTNVVPSERAVNTHSTSVGAPYADHSTKILLFGSSALTIAWAEKRYISQSQRTDCPAWSLALPRVNQNLEVIAGVDKRLEHLADWASNQHLGFSHDPFVRHFRSFYGESASRMPLLFFDCGRRQSCRRQSCIGATSSVPMTPVPQPQPTEPPAELDPDPAPSPRPAPVPEPSPDPPPTDPIPPPRPPRHRA